MAEEDLLMHAKILIESIVQAPKLAAGAWTPAQGIADFFGERKGAAGEVWTPAQALGGLDQLADIFKRQGLEKLYQEALQSLTQTVVPASKEMKKLGEAFGETEQSKQRLDRNLKKTTGTVDGFAARIVAMGGKLRSVSRLFFYASLDMLQLANAVLGPMRQGLTIFEEYNKTMTQMWVNFEFLSKTGNESLKLLEQRFIELADVTEFSRIELARAAAVFGTAGVAAQDISENLEELTKLARIGFTDMTTVANLTLRTMRRFRLSLEDAMSEMWKLTAIAQMTGESITDITNQMGYAVEMGQELGYTFSEIATSMKFLTEMYGTSSIAGRRLANIYTKLLQSGEEYGVQLRDLSGEMLTQRQHLENLADYLDLIGDPIEQNQYLMALFGTTGATAARTLVEAFKAGKLDEVMKDTGDSMIDTMRDLSDTIKDRLYVSLQDLRAEIQDLNLTLGQQLAPTIKNIIGPIVEALQAFALWVSDNQELIVGIGTLAVAITGLAIAIRTIGFLIEIIVALSTALVTLGAVGGVAAEAMLALSIKMGILVWAGSHLLSHLTMIALTIGVIAVAVLFIVGVIAGFAIAMQELGKYVDETGKEISFFGAIIKAVQGILQGLLGILKLIIGAIVAIAAAILFVGACVGAFIPMVLDLLGALKPLMEVLDRIGQGINVIGKAINDLGDELWKLIGSLAGHSPSLADRFFELGTAIRQTLNPMQQATMWGRRLTNAVGNVGAEMTLGYGRATAGALLAGGEERGQTVMINVDGAYIQDPEELAEIIAERQTRISRRNFRRTGY